MNKKALWISIFAVFISFIAGFIFANAFNRKEIADLQAELGRLKNASREAADTGGEQSLSEEEIRRKIEQADQNPEDTDFQKNLALALYRYAEMRRETVWLPDVARLLTRVSEKNPKDFNALYALGNIYFNLAQARGETESFEKAREFYRRALEVKPNDPDARADLGATYLYANPPDYPKAIAEFETTLKNDGGHERTLQNMAQAQIGAGKTEEAENFLEKLKQANPNNEALPELAAQIAQRRNARQNQ